MIQTISFKTRARTVDHLGREQIADAPTAISELWKNSYDAYARNVSLRVYDGETKIAALVDDGHGMSHDDFINRWLVVGTDVKLSDGPPDDDDRFGLPIRIKQGQKGIGRLSCAALGKLALIVSRRMDATPVAALIDWRLFENPFLLLDDIEIPVVGFSDIRELPDLLPAMRDGLIGNIWGGTSKDRSDRLAAAWKSYDELEKKLGRSSTREAIEAVVIGDLFGPTHFAGWQVWAGEVEHGTAIFMADLAFDLEALIAYRNEGIHDPAVATSVQRTRETLSSFIDPFGNVDRSKNEFHYSIELYSGDEEAVFLSDARELDYSNFEMLEHILEGYVDQFGAFKGRVKAFGNWLEEDVTINPDVAKLPKRADGKVGPFTFKVGAYEPVRNNSSLSDEEHAFVSKQANVFSGLFVFRDDLRVQPFGRPEYDFFEIEKRRSEQAGREFWSHRRMFGSIDISSSNNPNLRDKAGREGLIDNLAAKVFRELVQNILKVSARRYFGYDSEERKPAIEKIRAENIGRKAEEQRKKLAEKRRNEFRNKVRRNAQSLNHLLAELRSMVSENSIGDFGEAALRQRRTALLTVEERLHSFFVGDPPHDLRSFRAEYDDYAASYRAAALILDSLTKQTLEALEKIRLSAPAEIMRDEIGQREASLSSLSKTYIAQASDLVAAARDRMRETSDSLVSEFTRVAASIAIELEQKRLELGPALRRLDERFSSIRGEMEDVLQGVTSTFEALRDNIDLGVAASSGMDESFELREQLTRINALAQLGITVEIIGHELEGLDATITRGLKAFPADWHSLRAYQSVKAAHESLTERLQFLSPLKLSGLQTKERLKGHDIFRSLQEFFGKSLTAEGVSLSASDQFYDFTIFDRRSRILPVFLNLANNSRYWLAQTDKKSRQIRLDVRNGDVIFADNGPGVEPEDVKHLFTLFFTRKARSGRGVGLYLCKTNLAAGGHRIWYAEKPDEKILSGANFVMRFLRAEG